MGKGEKTTTQNSQTSYATPEEKALQQQQIDMNNFMSPFAKQNYADLSSNIQSVLEGRTPMAQGISGINEDQTQSMVNASLRDIYPQFQSAGILDSGAALQGGLRAASDIRNQNAQFNVSAAQNLFNLAAGGQSNLQGQYQGNTNSLLSGLAGLRKTNTSGSTIGMNPFLKSFEQYAGQGVGKFAGSLPQAAASSMGMPGCWVAAEVFDGWNDIRTHLARFYILFHAPQWFKNFYIKNGKSIAKFISNKPVLKSVVKKLFEKFVSIERRSIENGN